MLFKGRLRSQCFTLIELLIVMAIIAVLIAIALPAIQRVRDMANKTRSASNMRQLGIAVNAYEAGYNDHLPAGTSSASYYLSSYYTSGQNVQVYSYNQVPASGPNFGGLFGQLAGYLEADTMISAGAQTKTLNFFYYRDNTTNTYNYSYHYNYYPTMVGFGPRSVTVTSYTGSTAQIPVLQSPGDASFPAAAGTPTLTSYIGNTLVFTNTYSYTPTTMTTGRITDGVASTVFFAEGIANCFNGYSGKYTYPSYSYYNQFTPPAGGKKTSIYRYGTTRTALYPATYTSKYSVTPVGAAYWTSTSTYSSTSYAPPVYYPSQYTYYSYNYSTGTSTMIGPIQTRSSGLKKCQTNSPQALWRNDICQVCMGDGSVRGVKAGISGTTWYAVNTPNNGDVPGPDW